MGILLTETNAATNAGGFMGMMSVILLYGMLFLAMWFFFIRPQKKEQKRTAAMLAALEIGDCVLTTGGFIGIVIDISEDGQTIIVEFGSNKNCRIPMEKTAIARVEKPGEA